MNDDEILDAIVEAGYCELTEQGFEITYDLDNNLIFTIAWEKIFIDPKAKDAIKKLIDSQALEMMDIYGD